MNLSIDTLIQQSGTPISLPEVFIQLNKLTQDPASTVADIAYVIESDIGLTTRLLEIVNSPYYSFPSDVGSISRAVAIIGTKDLRDLVLTTTTIDLFANMQSKQENLRQLWRHSIYCAVISRILAESLNKLNTERLFVSGLLHDIGLMILYQGIPETTHHAIMQANKTGETLASIEKTILGYTHTDVGYQLATKWNLPDNIIEAIRFHHTPEKASDFPVETAIIHIANILTDMIDDENNLSLHQHQIDSDIWNISGLNTEVIDQVLKDAPQQLNEIYTLLFPKEQAA
ncbi:MAG: HDOD domain-containing protein [Gammaproteobacteria bacterium]|nr:HDOD domain-containing protein [Gammaproteobacteria bacterium]